MFDVVDVMMLRCGIAKINRENNEIITRTTKVGDIYNNVQEIRLKWYGHVMGRDNECTNTNRAYLYFKKLLIIMNANIDPI